MGVFDLQRPAQALDPSWALIAELAGGLIGAVVAVLLLIALF